MSMLTCLVSSHQNRPTTSFTLYFLKANCPILGLPLIISLLIYLLIIFYYLLINHQKPNILRSSTIIKNWKLKNELFIKLLPIKFSDDRLMDNRLMVSALVLWLGPGYKHGLFTGWMGLGPIGPLRSSQLGVSVEGLSEALRYHSVLPGLHLHSSITAPFNNGQMCCWPLSSWLTYCL